MSFEVSNSQINPVSETKDPWKHRSKGMVCATCMYFVEKDTGNVASDPAKKFGRCRCKSPTMKGYPAVFGNDWCGEHKLDEEKLLLG